MQTKRIGIVAALAAVLCAGLWLPGSSQAGTNDGRTASPPGKGVAELYAELYAKRQQQLTRLQAYANAGVFPHNTYRAGAVPVFVDGRGVRCAVGHLMHLDGQTKLVERTRRSNNLVRLHQVHEGPIVDWILGSGLTKEECEMIQPSYDHMRPRPRPPIRPIRPKPPVRVGTDQPAIQARLRATHRLLTQQTAQALETAVKRRLPSLGAMAGGEIAFDVVELRGGSLSLVPIHAGSTPTWVRLSYIGANGKLLRTGEWRRYTADANLGEEVAPAGAKRVLVEQAL